MVIFYYCGLLILMVHLVLVKSCIKTHYCGRTSSTRSYSIKVFARLFFSLPVQKNCIKKYAKNLVTKQWICDKIRIKIIIKITNLLWSRSMYVFFFQSSLLPVLFVRLYFKNITKYDDPIVCYKTRYASLLLLNFTRTIENFQASLF